jgi:hypothetical protein
MFLVCKEEAEALIKRPYILFCLEGGKAFFFEMKGGKENASHFKYSRHTLKPNNNLTMQPLNKPTHPSTL